MLALIALIASSLTSCRGLRSENSFMFLPQTQRQAGHSVNVDKHRVASGYGWKTHGNN